MMTRVSRNEFVKMMYDLASYRVDRFTIANKGGIYFTDDYPEKDPSFVPDLITDTIDCLLPNNKRRWLFWKR